MSSITHGVCGKARNKTGIKQRAELSPVIVSAHVQTLRLEFLCHKCSRLKEICWKLGNLA